MKRAPLGRSVTLLAALLVANLTNAAQACSVCMGDPASKTAGALNNAIFLMLGCVGLMLSGIGFFIFTLMQRAKAPMLPHQELAQSLGHESPTA